MATYRLFLLDDDGRISGPSEAWEADGDEDAHAQGLLLAQGGAAELWCGARRVRLYAKTAA